MKILLAILACLEGLMSYSPGQWGKAQDLDTVLAAAAILKALVPHAQIVLIGGGIEVRAVEDGCSR